MRWTAQEVPERINVSRARQEIKIVEQAFSNTFPIGFESAKNGLMAKLFYFAERVMTEMVQNSALDEVPDRNI